MVSKEQVYFINDKKNKVVKSFGIDVLDRVTISSNNTTLLVLHFGEHQEELVESFKRLELVVYLLKVQQLLKLPVFNFFIRRKFIVPTPERELTNQPDGKERGEPPLKISQESMDETLRNSIKCGYLQTKVKSWLGTSEMTCFCILTSVGLIFFKDYGDKKPTGFQPVLGSQLKQLEDGSKKQIEGFFSINYGLEKCILKAVSHLEASDWIRSIRSIQKTAKSANHTRNELKTYAK